jgi:hypothetical protein
VPAILQLPPNLSEPVIDQITARRPVTDTWLGYNVSRASAAADR